MSAQQASTSAGAGSSPSADAFASIITQVSPSGQPARAPARPVKRTAPKPRAPAATTEKPTPAVTSPPEASTSAQDPEKRRSDHDAQASAGGTATSKGSTLVAQPPNAKAQSQSPSRPRKKKRSIWTKVLIVFGCASPEVVKKTFDDEENKGSANEKTAVGDSAASGSSLGGASKETLPTATPDASTPVIAPEVAASQSRTGVALPRDETADVLSGAVVNPGAEGTPRKPSATRQAAATGDDEAGAQHTEGEHTEDEAEDGSTEEYMNEEEEEERLIAQGGVGIPIGEDGLPHPLLAAVSAQDQGRKCLVLDLDETLVHASFKLLHSADFVVPVEIEGTSHNVYVIKRPGVDAFLEKMGKLFEIVVFTASLSKYADPVLDQLDIHKVVKYRLFRESCYNHRGNYVKDLSQLGRDLSGTIILDNSPASYIFHPRNAVPVSSWFNDPHDSELTDLANVLTDLVHVDDVRGLLDVYIP